MQPWALASTQSGWTLLPFINCRSGPGLQKQAKEEQKNTMRESVLACYIRNFLAYLPTN